MSVSKEESLSPDEMRQKLYQTFKSRGVLDTLKTQLRNQLIQELQQPVRRGEAVPRRAAAHAHSVLVTACNSVIIDHLRSVGYEYTLSVFYPECGMSKDKVLSTRDLLQLMKISPHMPLYKALVSDIQKGQTGFLMSLFMELTDHHVHRDRCDTSTQTTSISAQKESLVEKMQLIDEEYEVLRHRGDRWASVEAKLAEYRKEIQEQAQVELEAKLQHFMDVEITKVKREEKEASRREILELRRDLERTYELKSEALTSREKNAIERLQKHQEIEEKEIYAQRQAVLKEIECVRSRETELKQRTEAFDKTCKLHEEKLKTLEDLLRRRELSVKSMEDSFEQKLKSELLKYQLELKEDYTKRTETLAENEKRIKAETVRLQKESAVIDAKAEEHERLLSEIKRLQMELESVRSQTSLLAQQNELLRQRLENVSDYSALKKDTQELQTHIRLLKHQLEEKHQENQRLRRELSGPSEELLTLQAELRRLETTRKLDQQEFETQKTVLQTQLQHEVQQCALLKAQLLECEERTTWMNAHTEELKLQLQHTQQGPALRGPLHPWSRTEAPEHDSGLVSGALARIRELEQEAERLEEAYRSHQQRAVHAAAAHAVSAEVLPLPRTTSGYRVTFASVGRPVEKEPLEGLSRTPSPRERNPLRLISPPARRLSSTPLSVSKSRRAADADQDLHSFTQERPSSGSDRAALMFAERQISPIPAGEMISSRDFTHISPPSSPRMKSTTRHSRSPPKLQEVISSSSQESSPQPEKITLHDLTDPIQLVSTDQECILERLQDSEPERRQEQQDEQASSSSDAAVKKDTREDEEKSWEEERKRREERRQREREEAQEREERELERLQREMEEQKDKRDSTEGHVTLTTSAIGGGTDEEGSGGADVANPLQKYMMMLMQDKPKEQSPNKEASENQSQEEILLSGNNDHSVGVTSHEEPDDDFW
ncbi:centriole and centriolar satellite protein ofd1 isoform X4 [Ctenopharyngodon idella]|uniref:centriole and centriolar satellite protein ofd1 isoform X4 n=1 Tax=Ctenopharyngodon idella TaxID=7959 RepID=UPI002231CABD|nr:centriole and centriolar satellite protein ofd1 isoform X4 [Ctenopharyngodon idella]